MNAPALILSNLAIGYADGGYKRQIVDYIDAQLYSGELVFREAQKLQGLQHMIDPYRIVDHVIVSFSPIKRNWSSLMLHSPIFRLPDHFYDNFIW